MVYGTGMIQPQAVLNCRWKWSASSVAVQPKNQPFTFGSSGTHVVPLKLRYVSTPTGNIGTGLAETSIGVLTGVFIVMVLAGTGG